MTSKLRSRPPIASADDFIAGADQQTVGSRALERFSGPGGRAESLQPSVTRAVSAEAQTHRHTYTWQHASVLH